MSDDKRRQTTVTNRDRQSLRIPLPPDEAMADLLKVPPPPEKKRRGGKTDIVPERGERDR